MDVHWRYMRDDSSVKHALDFPGKRIALCSATHHWSVADPRWRGAAGPEADVCAGLRECRTCRRVIETRQLRTASR